MATINDLKKYPKERILKAIDKGLWVDKEDVIYQMLQYLEKEDYLNERDREKELNEKWQNAWHKYQETYKAYKEYMWGIAEKYDIINKETNSYRFGDWIDSATKEEYNEALRLEKIQCEWFDKWQKYEKELGL